MNKINPLVVLVVLVGILIVIGGVYIMHNNQAAKDAQETSKRGEDVGKKMMEAQSQMGRPGNAGGNPAGNQMTPPMGNHMRPPSMGRPPSP